MTKMIDTFTDFVEQDNQGRKAAFMAAMAKRIQTERYMMGDLLYELFECQCDILHLKSMVNDICTQLDNHKAAIKLSVGLKEKKKKKEKAAK